MKKITLIAIVCLALGFGAHYIPTGYNKLVAWWNSPPSDFSETALFILNALDDEWKECRIKDGRYETDGITNGKISFINISTSKFTPTFTLCVGEERINHNVFSEREKEAIAKKLSIALRRIEEKKREAEVNKANKIIEALK